MELLAAVAIVLVIVGVIEIVPAVAVVEGTVVVSFCELEVCIVNAPHS